MSSDKNDYNDDINDAVYRVDPDEVPDDIEAFKKSEPFEPAGGRDVLDFVKRRVRELTKEEIEDREKRHESIVLKHKDVYADYIADGFTRNYAYIPPNDYFRSAMAYAMAKAYGVVEERNAMCDLFMEGYKGFTLCDDLNY